MGVLLLSHPLRQTKKSGAPGGGVRFFVMDGKGILDEGTLGSTQEGNEAKPSNPTLSGPFRTHG